MDVNVVLSFQPARLTRTCLILFCSPCSQLEIAGSEQGCLVMIHSSHFIPYEAIQKE